MTLLRWVSRSAIALCLVSCQTQPSNLASSAVTASAQTVVQAETQTGGNFATVTAVEATAGEPGAYTFAVTVQSPDTGCDRYANWWEVISAEGDLIFRRILAHSHVDEQPFRRAGGSVAVQPDQTVIIRAHMQPTGYGNQAMQGSIDAGFSSVQLPDGFAANLAQAAPQPLGCDH
ncbi:MAG: hypothetical protein HC886_17315 [Leptolyngbyaceae cyanobacterium SM1_1_3]|nr:hypothetical protein [Leptolyngbyaceae cyanobacterium SM1_1_3]NJM85125.1 hypothetical protein [Leptolyngbyaceae cyanobacterium RM2_2_21]NJN02509.1 hypothetical protein [Leptolyngbyaceae cyanobacterium RM1_1_2]NJO11046.1 hypothetical protein [Leptolyngbyaceae cyanobacterium SL_1_1]